MELSIKSLQDAGAFTGAPVEKEVKWEQDGKEITATVFVRKLSYKSAVSDMRQFGGEILAGRIAACICDKKGKAVLSVEDITGTPEENKADSSEEKERKRKVIERGPLNHNLCIALINVIAEVNFLGKQKA